MISSMLSTMNNEETPTKQNSKQSNSNNFLELAKLLIDKSNLTKGQIFYLIMTVLFFGFVLLIAATPTIVSIVTIIMGQDVEKIKPPIDMKAIPYGIGLWLLIGIIYFIAFSIPEIRDRWRIQKDEDDL